MVAKELVRLPPPVVVGKETYPVISFTLNEEGTKLFRDLTRKNAPMDEKGKNAIAVAVVLLLAAGAYWYYMWSPNQTKLTIVATR